MNIDHGKISKVARAAAITPQYLWMIAKGVKSNPSPAVIMGLMEATGAPSDTWLFGTPEQKQKAIQEAACLL